MFIPTTNTPTFKHCSGSGIGSSGGGSIASITSTRHYRSPGHFNHPSSAKVHETKRNKRVMYDESIWTKIEQDFTPELLQEQKMNIPDIIENSPKQTSSNPMAAASP